MKDLGERIYSMFVHLAAKMIATDSLANAIILVVSFILLQKKKWIAVERFDINSPTHYHHDPEALCHLASNMDMLKDNQG